MSFPQIPPHVLQNLINPPPLPPTPAAPQSAPAAPTVPDDDERDPYAPSDFSEIRIHVRVPLTIRGNGNLITVDNSTNGNRLALGMVQALNQLSLQSMGLPMIDEEGRPRPVKCDVDADIYVDGSNNVIGEKAVLAAIEANGSKAGRKAILKAGVEEVEVNGKNFKGENGKREREEEDQGAEEDEAMAAMKHHLLKRTRHE